MKNTKSFQERFNRWKNGESYWDIVGKPLRELKPEKLTIDQAERDYLDSVVALYERGKDSVILNTISYNQWRENLPNNLKKETSDYDLYGAYKAGMEPHLEDDGYYHLGSRDPKTGKILKLPQHPTYLKALNEDAKLGYFPIKSKDGYTYTDTWKGNNPGYAKYFPGKDGNTIDQIYDHIIDATGLSEQKDYVDTAVELGKLLDPTGISNYNDASKAISTFYNNPNLTNAGSAALNIIGSLPILGKVTVPFKIAKLAAESGKFGKVVKSVSDINKQIDTVKELVPGVKQVTKTVLDITSKVSNKALDIIHDPHPKIAENAGKYAIRYANLANKINAAVNGVNFINEGYNTYLLLQQLKKPNISNWYKTKTKH